MEGVLPRSLKAAVGSARASSSIVDEAGLMRLLGQLHLKLVRVLARVSARPNRMRNKVRVLGLTDASG
jgi:hypothetical protein